jgi:hypothetical protein
MSSLTEEKRPGAFILTEQPGTLSRETVIVTVGATTTLHPGLVLGQITSGGKFVPLNNDATPAADGSQNARAILYAEIKNAGVAAADFDGVVVDFGAEVRDADLDYNGSDEAEAKADLAGFHIKVRD